jgi:cell filamentation protein
MAGLYLARPDPPRVISVAIAKGDLFALPPYIAGEMERRFALIHREKDLRGFSADRFAARAAEHICEINAIHPFREGNGRTQRLFLKALARQAGHELRIDLMDREQWMRASIESFRRQDYAPMTACIRAALLGQGRDRSEGRHKDTDRSREMD